MMKMERTIIIIIMGRTIKEEEAGITVDGAVL
jgi:hypothetical protein